MTPRATLCRAGLRLGDRTVPLRSGSVHYWRLDPRDWRRALEQTRAMGLHLVDTYVPWGVHEAAPGDFDFGDRDPRLDVAAFLRIAHEVGLLAIVRPGPHVNAELTYFGLPERVVWSPDCQARTPKGNPVMLPMVPVAFPVPSYASEAFHAEVRGWYRAVAKVLAPLRWPEGPIALVQIDNEGALYFRDGAYDQDYRPEALALFRDHLRAKYGDLARLRDAWGDPEATFDALEPPTRFDATSAAELPRHLDWAKFHEHLLATALGRMARELAAAGLSELPTMHNFPFGQEATPLNAARIAPAAVDLCGLDYYHRASPREHDVVRRRTTELSARCDAADQPAFACELGAGFPPFFAPIDEHDSLFTALTALAYGLRGYNLYMAVERDRWIGAPIDVRGRKRPFADAWTRLARALDELDFHRLVRRAPVALVTPRSQRRLARAMHAFGPATGALFAMLGKGGREGSLEDDLGLGTKVALEADEFLDAFEQALSARGVPFAHVGGEDAGSLAGARWIVCASNGGLAPHLVARLANAARAGAIVTLGPRPPDRDAAMRPHAHDLSPFELLPGTDPSSIDAAVAHAAVRLALPTLATDPDGLFATVHEDDAGRPRCLFVGNPGDRDLVARVSIRVASASDLLDEAHPTVGDGFVELRVAPKTVRMLRID